MQRTIIGGLDMKEKQKKEATSSWGCRFDGSFTLKEFANGIGFRFHRIKYLLIMELVPFEIAKKLADKGFDKPTLLLYNDNGIIHEILPDVFTMSKESNFYRAPRIDQIMKWLMEEKHLFVDISLCAGGYYGYIYSTIFQKDKDFSDGWSFDGKYDTYESAALAAIEYVLDKLI